MVFKCLYVKKGEEEEEKRDGQSQNRCEKTKSHKWNTKERKSFIVETLSL